MSAPPTAGTTSPPFNLSRLIDSPLFAQVAWHDAIDSTNTLALQSALQPELPTPYLIGAEQQTAGRGRGNHRWWSAPGALTFSLILNPRTDFAGPAVPPLNENCWPRISLVAALALCDVLAERVPAGKPRLKWPNDVHLAGRKVAGILVEVPPQPAGTARRLVLGIGINVNNSLVLAPEEIRSVAAALCDITGGPMSREELLLDWMERFGDHARSLATGAADLADGWRSYCLLAGQTVTLQAGNRTVAGHCLGIDDEGALLIDTPTGTERCFGGVLVRIQPSPAQGASR
ncbi:MAG: biotin--[acetyl-CoA-carboxylase] ligase [Planctomycetaceae bacterium]|nr:MAG: biotin--[acetyl-CoA-carboxylase] ligase [Planctomycetaceae bacterium]